MASNPPAQISADAYSSIAGMSKSQLYDLMSQMKMLIDQNQQQARQILVDNPQLTKALFQAQIMLGMVKPRPLETSSEPPPEQPEQQQPKVQTTQPLPVQTGLQGQVTSSQFTAPARQQNEPQPSISLPSAPSPPLSFPAQTISDSVHVPQQAKVFMNAPVSSVSALHSSQIHSLPLPPPPAPQQFPNIPSHMLIGSNQGQPPLHTPGMFNPHLPPHLLQQWRPPSMPPFSHQMHQPMPHSLGFQPSNAPHPHLSQPMFHLGGNHSSPFPQGNPQMPSQLPPQQQFYQGGSHMGLDYGNQFGSSMQAERGAHWAQATGGPHLPGPPPSVPGQMLPGSSTSGQRPPPLTSDVEKALLQQVMSLTPEQINRLPPEQRQQVIQLQEMLR